MNHKPTDDQSDDNDSSQRDEPFEAVPDGTVLTEHAESIRQLGRKIVADVIEIGRRLSECKRIVGHGHWLSWLQREFGWSERTARNLMSGYEFSRSKSANFADLTIDISSLYLLASPSTPEAAGEDIMRRLGEGEVLSFSQVKNIVSAARDASGRRRITMRDVKNYHSGYISLPSAARDKVLKAGPENFGLAFQDALMRQAWPAPFRDLRDVLDLVEALRKRWSMRKLFGAISPEQLSTVIHQVESATGFLTKLALTLRKHSD